MCARSIAWPRRSRRYDACSSGHVTFVLYYAPGACSISPHTALREAELPFELVRVDLASKTYDGEHDFLEVNPKGYVFVLCIFDGCVVIENLVTIQYVADRVPQ